MDAGEADWDEQVFVFILLGHQRFLRDGVRPKAADLDITFVAGVAMFIDTALRIGLRFLNRYDNIKFWIVA